MDAAVWVETIGWGASAITIATYAVNTMVPLRVLAFGSSVLFIVYALLLQLWPLLVMEAILLPINGYRLWQIVSLRRRLLSLSADMKPDYSIVQRYGQRTHFDAGAQIFARGDTVDKFYYIAAGQVRIEEHNLELRAGDIFGEIAFFTVGTQRMASARCTHKTTVYALDKKRFMRLQFEDPTFGLAVMQSVTTRLHANRVAEPA